MGKREERDFEEDGTNEILSIRQRQSTLPLSSVLMGGLLYVLIWKGMINE